MAGTLLAVLAAPQTVAAQNEGLLVLTLPVSTRAAAMGNAWVAGRDEYGLFYNPALAATTSMPVGVTFAQYGDRAFSLATASGATVGPVNIGWGVHLANFSVAPARRYPYTIADVVGAGDADASSLVGVLAANVTKKGVRFGVGAKYAHDVTPSVLTSSVRHARVLADLGATRSLFSGTIGLAVQNIGTPYTRNTSTGAQSVSVPAQLALGWTASRSWGEFDYTFATQLLARRHGFVSPGGGIDVGYSWIEGYAVNARVGARRPDTKDERPVSVGAAFNADRLNMEYALGFVAGSKQVHRVTLRWR